MSAGLELPAGVRKRRKATVKIRRNPLFRVLPLIQLNKNQALLEIKQSI